MTPRERLIVALDVPKGSEALQLVDRLADRVGLFKIGLQLFTAEGPKLVREIVDRGCRVFLDLKLHDIPNTVASAGIEAARLGVHMLTLHTLGGESMLESTAERVRQVSQSEGLDAPLLLGVTILTSMDSPALATVGLSSSIDENVLALGRMAQRAGLGGVVCSPLEIRLLREGGVDRMKLVTPGIRPAHAAKDDQARTMRPAEAIREGGDYLVIGRPITNASDPAAAAASILLELEQAGPETPSRKAGPPERQPR